MSDFDAQLPVRTVATEFTTEIANASGVTINPAEEFPQGATTSGESGPLVQGAVTSSPPSYTNGQTNPLSLDTSGNLRVAVTSLPASDENVNIDKYGGSSTTLGQKPSASSIPVVIASDQSTINVQIPAITPITNYFTDVAVASGSSISHSVAGALNIDEIWVSASGEIKVTVAWGTTGSEVTELVGFTSASNKIFNWTTKNAVSLTSGQSVKVTIKNLDTSAQDTYLTIITH